MWYLFYQDKEQIKNLCNRLKVEQPHETKISTSKSKKKGVDFSLGFSKFFSSLIKADTNASVTSDHIRSKDITYNHDNYTQLINALLDYLEANEATLCSFINSEINTIYDGKIVKFFGSFAPDIDDESYRERLASYEERDHINWHGVVDGVEVIFGTSKKNIASNTPLSTLLLDNPCKMYMEGYGICISPRNIQNKITLKPILIGRKHGNLDE